MAHRDIRQSAIEPEALHRNPPSAESREGRLDSWKEIAGFLGRGVRTVQRWEREEGLPVHRLAHEKRGSVYARRDELAAWWESRRSTLTTQSGSAEPLPAAAAPKLVRVTRTSAATFWPALSSDARMVAFVSDGGEDGAMPQLWLQQIGGAAIRLTNGLRGCSDPSFTAGDTRIVFTALGDDGQNVYEMPSLGGQPRLLKRTATAARVSPDGKWLAYVALGPTRALRIDALDNPNVHKIAPTLIDVAHVTWSPDSKVALVYAHPDATLEPEYWIVPLDGRPPISTGVAQQLRQRGVFLVGSAPAWMDESLIFSVVTRDGVHLWRQPIEQSTFQPVGDPKALTSGTDMDHFPAAAAGRLAFVSTHQDQNLWSVALDVSSGGMHGSLHRMTRGPGIVGHMTLTDDGRTMSYFMARSVMGEVRIRDLASSADNAYSGGPAAEGTGYPAISPSGAQLAFGLRTFGPRAMRPIFIADLSTGTFRQLCDDCGARPREWLDERFLLIETFGSRLNTLAILDTTDASRRSLVASATRAVTNPRLSPDRRWVAFDAASPGGSPSVIVAPMTEERSIGESDWITIERNASHPFWSADGRFLYYLPTTPSLDLRSVVKAQPFDSSSARPQGESFEAFRSSEMVVPTFLTNTAPIATPDSIIFVLGDFRGDVWMMDLASERPISS